MSEIVSEELKYTTSTVNHSSIQFRNISPQASSTVTTSVTSSVGPTEFLISPTCFNPAKSRLDFRLSFASGGVGNFTFVNANLLTTIARIVIYDSGTNATLLDVSNFEKYATLTVPTGTSMTDFLSKSNGGTTAGTDVASAALLTYEDISRFTGTSGNVINIDGAATPTMQDMATLNPVLGRRQWINSAAATALVVDCSLPFDAFKGTFLQTNKVIYCPTNLVLQIYWNANNQYAFLGSNLAQPQTGVLPLATAVSISGINIALACESNLSIISQVIQKTMSGGGMVFQIPYPTTTRQSLASSTSHSYSLQLTRAYGNRILYLMSAPFVVGTNNLANVHTRGTITVYNTFLNNVAIKYPASISAVQSEDFLLANKEYLKGSVVQTLQEYRYSWCHIDSFFGEKSMASALNYHDVDGLDVGSASSTWMLQATLSAATDYAWITIIMGTKQLTISNMGASVM